MNTLRTIMPTQLKPIYIILMGAASTVLLFALFVYVAFAYNLITFPFDYDQGEGFELVDTVMFSEGRWPYQDTEAFPFYSSNYPPLYHVLLAPFVWFFGTAYWYGRLFSFLTTIISAGAIFWVVYRQNKLRWIALLAALAFFSSNTIYHIGPLFRQHISMVMFETLAIIVLANAFPKKRTGGIILGLLLLIAAGYTKQLAAITAIAALAWMLLRNPRRGILWSIGFTVVGAAIFAWMYVDTNGEWWRQAIVANVNEFRPDQAIGLIRLWIGLHGALILPAVLYVIYEVYFSRISLYSVWFVFAAILGAVGSGTWGAGDSYFATAIAAMCILSGLFFSKLLSGDWHFNDSIYKRRLITPLRGLAAPIIAASAVVIPLLYLAYGVATFKMPTTGAVFGTIANVLNIQPNVTADFYDSATWIALGYAQIGQFTTAEDVAAGYEIVEAIQNTPTHVISEDAGFSMVAGREVITNPTQLRNLWLAGLWQGDEILSMVENQEFGLIVLRAQFYPQPFLETLVGRYEQTDSIQMNGFNYLLLRPIE